jgi:hypothetical protein
VLRLCRLRTIHCRPVVSRDFAVIATYSGKHDILAIPLCEKTTMHWEWEMARIACTHLVNLSGMAQGGGVLYSWVVQIGSHFGGSE